MASKANPKLVAHRVRAPQAPAVPGSRSLNHLGHGSTEGIADEGHRNLFEILKRKYPHIDPKELKEHLAKPLELQPLWLASGKSVAMNREERAEVILAHFRMCCMTFEQPASTKPLQRIFLRAIKRQVRLTYKQWQVARLTVDGLDIKVIAERLKVVPRMVKTHLEAIRRKAKLTRNAEIVRWFLGY